MWSCSVDQCQRDIYKHFPDNPGHRCPCSFFSPVKAQALKRSLLYLRFPASLPPSTQCPVTELQSRNDQELRWSAAEAVMAPSLTRCLLCFPRDLAPLVGSLKFRYCDISIIDCNG